MEKVFINDNKQGFSRAWKVCIKEYKDGLKAVEFHDMSVNPRIFPNGQFVCSYYLTTLLERESNCGLDLMGYVPSWKITWRDLQIILSWLCELTTN